MLRHNFFGIAFYVLLIAITVMSLVELEINLPQIKISFFDKVVHTGAYAVLMVTGGIFYLAGKEKKDQNRRVVVLGLLLVVYGILIEILQKVLPVNRWWEVWDILANVIGVLLGVLVLRAFSAKILR
ncbi:MAG: VanZ family protein [Flavobacteriaceae bacterium]|nr:VanZ family protein [Flavobacteriaceae bacterium]MDH3795289.1 VanZ family protein [Flavobacteriaceae bacterium]